MTCVAAANFSSISGEYNDLLQFDSSNPITMCLDCWGLVIRIRSTSNVVNFFAVRRRRIDLATLSGNVRAGLFMTRRRPLLGPVFFLLLLLAACAAPVTVEKVDPRVVHRELTANVLTVGEESHASRIVLNRWYLTERFWSDPEGTLAQLHTAVTSGGAGRDKLFALAELSFLHAERTRQTRILPGSGRLCLCSAVSKRRCGAA